MVRIVSQTGSGRSEQRSAAELGKQHPHIDKASDEQILDVLREQERKPELQQVYLKIHQLMLETLPDVVYSTDMVDGVTGYGARQYGYDGWGLGAVGAHKNWVSLMLFKGAHLDDPAGLLEGTGKNLRHVKVRSLKQFEERRKALQALIEQALTFNEA